MRKDGAQIEERLRGMLVHAVAGVDDGQACGFFEQPGRAGRVVAEDDGLSTECAESEAGVLERLAFFNAGAEVGDERCVGAESF